MVGAGAKSRIRGLRPMLAVIDLPRAVRFYVEKLGFNCNAMHGNPPEWAEVERDGTAIMLNAPPADSIRRDVPLTSKNYQIFYIDVQNVATLREEFVSKGVEAGDMRVAIYGMKEFEVRDPEGYWLWFGEPTDEAPTACEE
ncbi:MAG: VOC family protein [Phycisphaeraceae bacterium]|nr:VOC family protein [Phycisphaeraceae bacterium]